MVQGLPCALVTDYYGQNARVGNAGVENAGVA